MISTPILISPSNLSTLDPKLSTLKMATPAEVIEALAQFRDDELSRWPLAKKNYDALAMVERKPFVAGALHGAVQYNPARAVSTGAKVDKDSIKARPCFLCAANRPPEQTAVEIIPGWDMLVNPFPIFPLHFTIALREHCAQDAIPLEMASMAEKLPGMAIFFNGARAGASAPDHMHCQAVMARELPLLNYLENGGDAAALPFKVCYFVITPDIEGMLKLKGIENIRGVDAVTGKEDTGLLNAFMWIGEDGLLRVAVVLRSAHRPKCYTSDAGNADGMMISPGAVDMAGIIITPRKSDFERIQDEDIAGIFEEVGGIVN